jgi:hypothetical protein
MNLSDEVDLEDYVSRPDKISAADVSTICSFLLIHFLLSFFFLSNFNVSEHKPVHFVMMKCY